MFKILLIIFYLLYGDWGLGIGDWGLGIGDWAQSPIPNPHTNLYCYILNIKNYLENILIKL